MSGPGIPTRRGLSTGATAVVTLNAGRDQHLLRLAEGLAACDPAPSELVVVGWGTEAQPVDAVERRLPGVPVRWVDLGSTHGGPLPLARARNAGAEATTCPNLIFLDVDCIPAPDLVGASAAALRTPGVVAGPVRWLERFWDHDVEGLPGPELLHARSAPHPVRPVPPVVVEDARHELLWSLAFAMRHTDFDAIGGFDENYVGYGAEDTDLGLRARAAGLPMRWLPSGTAYHQWHRVSDPPVEHLDAIVENACRFHRTWGRWPMEGWLAAFAADGLVDWDPSRGSLTRSGGIMEAPVPRVVAIPATHPYTRRVLPDDVVCDPDPSRPWWPHPSLEPGWIEQHVDPGDVVHLHFGFEHRTPEEMSRWCRAVHAAGGALVVTVHDIDNPHLAPSDQAPHWERLAIVLAAADAVLTLTPAAAREIDRRWGREAQVVPHPHVAAVDHRASRRTGPARRVVVGTDLKALRPGQVEAELLLAALGAAARGARTAAVAWVEDGVPEMRLDALRTSARRHGVDLRIEPAPDDAALARRFASVDVAVLPYRSGTHSGLLELCRDVGTRPVVPTRGCYRDQWREAETFGADPQGHPDGLTDAIRRAIDRGPVPVERAGWRAEQLVAIRRAHSDVYRATVAAMAVRS